MAGVDNGGGGDGGCSSGAASGGYGSSTPSTSAPGAGCIIGRRSWLPFCHSGIGEKALAVPLNHQGLTLEHREDPEPSRLAWGHLLLEAIPLAG